MLANLYCTAHTLTEPPGPVRIRRDHTDPELASHLQGFEGFVMRLAPERTSRLFAVVQTIKHVRHHLVVDDYDHRWGPWLSQSYGIVFTPEGDLLDPLGMVLFGRTPSTDAEVPMAPDAKAHVEAGRAWMRTLGVEVPALTPGLGAAQAVPRSATDAARRGLALLAAAARADTLPKPLSSEELADVFGASVFSPEEQQFLEATEPPKRRAARKKGVPMPEPRRVNHFTWGFESGAALLAAVGGVEIPESPTHQVAVPQLLEQVRAVGAEAIVASATLPAVDTLLATTAKLRCANWAVRQAVQFDGKPPPGGFDMGVVAERHKAYNWLTGQWAPTWDATDTPS